MFLFNIKRESPEEKRKRKMDEFARWHMLRQDIAAIDLEMKANARRSKNYRDDYFYEQPQFLGENQ